MMVVFECSTKGKKSTFSSLTFSDKKVEVSRFESITYKG